MPGKGRRVASRQAQLGRKRRRQSRGTGGVSTAGPQADGTQSQAEGNVATKVHEPVAPSQNASNTAPSRPAAAPPIQPRAVRSRADRPVAYNYVGPELRRILILSGVLTVALVVLAFFV